MCGAKLSEPARNEVAEDQPAGRPTVFEEKVEVEGADIVRLHNLLGESRCDLKLLRRKKDFFKAIHHRDLLRLRRRREAAGDRPVDFSHLRCGEDTGNTEVLAQAHVTCGTES